MDVSSVIEVTECARGCTVTVGFEEEAQRIPAVAAPGTVLCTKCAARLVWRLGDVADVAARARLALVPGQAASTSGERVGGTPDRELPFNIAAFETCDRLVNLTGGWCVRWGALLGVAVPENLRRAATSGAELAGVKAGTDAETVADALDAWMLWFRYQMDAILAHPAAAEFHDEIVDGVGKAARRFPRDEPREVEQRPRYCPVCELRHVRVTWTGADPEVRCGSCGWEFETEWGGLLESLGFRGSR